MSDTQSKGAWWSNKTVLVLSLAFNVFFIGTVVGGAVIGNRLHDRSEQIRHAPPIHSFASPRKLMRHVDKEDKGELVKVMRNEMKQLRPELERVGELRQKAMQALMAKPFDEAAAESAFAELAIVEAKVHEASNLTLIKLLKALPEDERQEALQRMHQHRMEKERFKMKRRERREEKWSEESKGE